MEDKKRYAVAYYNNEERVNDPEWMTTNGNKLVAYIYDNQSEFNFRYKCSDKEENRTWFILDPKELEKAKEHFAKDDGVLEWINDCNNYDKCKTSCECCDSISINTSPYTYRESYGCISKVYNCAFCGAFTNRTASKVEDVYNENGLENAIDFIIAINKGEYVDNDEKYICRICGCDSRKIGIVEDGEAILIQGENNEYYRFTIEEYNNREIERANNIEGYRPYFFEDKKEEYGFVHGYRCFECNEEIKDDIVNEFLSLERK